MKRTLDNRVKRFCESVCNNGFHQQNWFKLLVVALLFVLPSIGYLLRSGFHGTDSYYYLTLVCRGTGFEGFRTGFLAQFEPLVFGLLPCEPFLLKLLLIFLYGLSLVILWQVFEVWRSGLGWLGLFFCGFALPWLRFFFSFENEMFVYPLMFLALLFFFLFLKNRSRGRFSYVFLLACVLCLGVGALLWQGVLFYLAFFALHSLVLLVLFGIVLVAVFFWYGSFLGVVFGNWGVSENNPLHGFLFFFVYFVFLKELNFWRFPFLLMSLGTVFLGVVNPKFFIFAVPFLAIGLCRVYIDFSRERLALLVLGCIFLVVWATPLSPFLGFETTPHSLELELVEEGVWFAEFTGKKLVNDWELGHVVSFFGGVPSHHSGIPSEPLVCGHDVVMISRLDCAGSCVLIRRAGLGFRELFLWNC
jgi:hypothetical protein